MAKLTAQLVLVDMEQHANKIFIRLRVTSRDMFHLFKFFFILIQYNHQNAEILPIKLLDNLEWFVLHLVEWKESLQGWLWRANELNWRRFEIIKLSKLKERKCENISGFIPLEEKDIL